MLPVFIIPSLLSDYLSLFSAFCLFGALGFTAIGSSDPDRVARYSSVARSGLITRNVLLM
jgi:hypothetical protein